MRVLVVFTDLQHFWLNDFSDFLELDNYLFSTQSIKVYGLKKCRLTVGELKELLTRNCRFHFPQS